jgi:hypothetical protein
MTDSTADSFDINVDEGDSTEKLELLLKVIGILITLGVCAYIIWSIHDFFTCKPGDQSLGCVVDNAFGAGASVLLGLVKGCVKQEDCKKFKNDKTTCNETNTCKWSEGNGGYCRGTTGYKAGEGGLFDLHCGIFVGLLLFSLASAFLTLAKLGLQWFQGTKFYKDRFSKDGSSTPKDTTISDLDTMAEQAGRERFSQTKEGRDALVNAASDANEVVGQLPEGSGKDFAREAIVKSHMAKFYQEKGMPAAAAQTREEAKAAAAQYNDHLPATADSTEEKAAEETKARLDEIMAE